MVNFHGLILLTLFVVFSYSAQSYASNQDFAGQSPFFRNSAGNWINSKDFNTQLSAGKLTYEGQYRVQSPSTGRAFPVTLSRAADVDVSRMGSAVKSFAKFAGPIGVGIVMADLICEKTTICAEAEEWFFGTPSDTLTGFANCSTVAKDQEAHYQHTNGTLYQYKRIDGCTTAPAGFGLVSSCPATDSQVCFQNDKLLQKVTPGGTPPVYRAATDADFDFAETAMNDADFTEPMHTAKQDLPVSAPDAFPPVNTIVGEKTTSLKDSGGNVIGTQVETTTLSLTDTSSPTSPNTIDVKETKTTINYDINNNITDQSTTVIEGPPAVPPAEESDIEFDDMEEEDLEEWEMPDVFTWESWGDGTCPANRSVDYAYGSLELSFEPACSFASDVKPILLIIAGIIAMYIISGIRTD